MVWDREAIVFGNDGGHPTEMYRQEGSRRRIEKTIGVYSRQLIDVIGEGAYDVGGHKNARFIQTNNVGTYPTSMQFAWQLVILDAAYNRGLAVDSNVEEWGKLGPLAAETPADVRNKGTEARPRRTEGSSEGRRSEANARNNGTASDPESNGTRAAQGLDDGISSTQEWAEAMQEVLEEMTGEDTTQAQTDQGQREMMQEDGQRQGSNLITQARTTTTYSPVMEGTYMLSHKKTGGGRRGLQPTTGKSYGWKTPTWKATDNGREADARGGATQRGTQGEKKRRAKG